jgi:hypothetical protein
MYASLLYYQSFCNYSQQNQRKKEGFTDIPSKPFMILIKFPSRSRPDKLKNTYKTYISMASRPDLIRTLVSLDEDDLTVTSELVDQLHNIHGQTQVVIGKPSGKIGAVNRDMEQAGEYDILLLASDDMIPVTQGYDEIIRRDMSRLYPDRDGVLWYNDGFQGPKLNTLCIIGKPYYQRFGYIYHPSYKSLYCDNEFTEVANRLGLQTYLQDVIIRHEHPDTTSVISYDDLYKSNQSYVYQDHSNFITRRKKGFP